MRRTHHERPTRREVLQAMAVMSGSALLAACGGGGQSSGSQGGGGQRGGTLRLAVPATGPSEPLDPAAGLSSGPVHSLIWDRLTYIRNDMSVAPELATSWSSSSDLMNWTFKLRPGVKFHDGRPVTGKDVVRSFQRVLDPSFGSQALRVFQPLVDPDRIEAPDDTTVVFHCKTPIWNMPATVASDHCQVVPADTPMQVSKVTMGSGPFMYEDYSAGVHLFVKRNPNYWRKGYPLLDAIKVYNVASASQRVNGIISSQFDLAMQLDPVAAKSIQGNGRYHVYTVKSGSVVDCNMMVTRKPFDDVRVRQAMKLAVNRKAAINTVYLGQAVEGDDQIIPPMSPLYAHAAAPAYDPTKARQLLAAAGHPNGIDITMTTADVQGDAIPLAEAYQQSAKAANIRVSINQVPADSYYNNINALKFDFWVEPYGMQPSDQLLYIQYAMRGAGPPPSQWMPPNLMPLLASARSETDAHKREDLYAQIQKMIASEGPTIMMAFQNALHGSTAKVRGFDPGPIPTYNFSFWPISMSST